MRILGFLKLQATCLLVFLKENARLKLNSSSSVRFEYCENYKLVPINAYTSDQ